MLCCRSFEMLVIIVYEKIILIKKKLKYNIDLKYSNNAFDKFFIGLELFKCIRS